MKKLILPILLLLVLPLTWSCSSLNKMTLSEADAASAIRQLLQIGTRESINSTFNQQSIMAALFPESMRKTLNTLQTLGLSNEIDRFTNTLATASQKTAERSVPIFVNAIDQMTFTDALQIVKNGGTSATDYLRSTTGSDLRKAITPVMKSALEEYKLNEQWNNIMKPAQALVGNKLNLDLPTLMAGLVTEKMFQQIAVKEQEIRSTASARTTPLLRKVFSRQWGRETASSR
jgi:hypothetical protein